VTGGTDEPRPGGAVDVAAAVNDDGGDGHQRTTAGTLGDDATNQGVGAHLPSPLDELGDGDVFDLLALDFEEVQRDDAVALGVE